MLLCRRGIFVLICPCGSFRSAFRYASCASLRLKFMLFGASTMSGMLLMSSSEYVVGLFSLGVGIVSRLILPVDIVSFVVLSFLLSFIGLSSPMYIGDSHPH